MNSHLKRAKASQIAIPTTIAATSKKSQTTPLRFPSPAVR
jgi:hypothetical protein